MNMVSLKKQYLCMVIILTCIAFPSTMFALGDPPPYVKVVCPNQLTGTVINGSFTPDWNWFIYSSSYPAKYTFHFEAGKDSNTFAGARLSPIFEDAMCAYNIVEDNGKTGRLDMRASGYSDCKQSGVNTFECVQL